MVNGIRLVDYPVLSKFICKCEDDIERRNRVVRKWKRDRKIKRDDLLESMLRGCLEELMKI
jgi:hypothetical protein